MGKAERTKGHNFERLVANIFKPYFGGARRGIQYRDGSDAPDVVEAPWWIECKHQKNVSIKAALRQAKEASGHKPCITVTRGNREPIIVSMYIDDFLSEFVDKLYKKEQDNG